VISIQSCEMMHSVTIGVGNGCFGGTLAICNCPMMVYIDGADGAIRTENTHQTPMIHMSEIQVDFDG
jgi:hypothetical protein